MQEQLDEDYSPVVTAAMMWDMLPAENVIPLCAEAGVTPPDADGAAVEQAASQARRQHIGTLLPWIEVLSVIAAEIEALAVIRPAFSDPTPAYLQLIRDDRDHYEMTAFDTILPAACAVVSILVDRGFLQVTDRGRKGTLSAFLGE